jgi:hypothetical protein
LDNLYVLIDGKYYRCDEIAAAYASGPAELTQAASSFGSPPGDPSAYPFLPVGADIAAGAPSQDQILQIYKGLQHGQTGMTPRDPNNVDPRFGRGSGTGSNVEPGFGVGGGG